MPIPFLFVILRYAFVDEKGPHAKLDKLGGGARGGDLCRGLTVSENESSHVGWSEHEDSCLRAGHSR